MELTKGDLPAPLLEALDRAVHGPLAAYRPLRVFLFGSRAAGTADERSDYDIGLEAARPLSSRDLAEVREAFDSAPLLARVDVVDFSRVDENFRAHALRATLTLHDRAA